MWTAIQVNPYTALPVAAMVISLMTFVATQLTSRRREGKDYLGRVEDRNEKLEKDLEDCKRRNAELLEENILLLRRIANIRLHRKEGEDSYPGDDV